MDYSKTLETFNSYQNIIKNKKELEVKLLTHSLFDLQVFATNIGVIPHMDKNKLIKRISLQLYKNKKYGNRT